MTVHANKIDAFPRQLFGRSGGLFVRRGGLIRRSRLLDALRTPARLGTLRAAALFLALFHLLQAFKLFGFLLGDGAVGLLFLEVSQAFIHAITHLFALGFALFRRELLPLFPHLL